MIFFIFKYSTIHVAMQVLIVGKTVSGIFYKNLSVILQLGQNL